MFSQATLYKKISIILYTFINYNYFTTSINLFIVKYLLSLKKEKIYYIILIIIISLYLGILDNFYHLNILNNYNKLEAFDHINITNLNKIEFLLTFYGDMHSALIKIIINLLFFLIMLWRSILGSLISNPYISPTAFKNRTNNIIYFFFKGKLRQNTLLWDKLLLKLQYFVFFLLVIFIFLEFIILILIGITKASEFFLILEFEVKTNFVLHSTVHYYFPMDILQDILKINKAISQVEANNKTLSPYSCYASLALTNWGTDAHPIYNYTRGVITEPSFSSHDIYLKNCFYHYYGKEYTICEPQNLRVIPYYGNPEGRKSILYNILQSLESPDDVKQYINNNKQALLQGKILSFPAGALNKSLISPNASNLDHFIINTNINKILSTTNINMHYYNEIQVLITSILNNKNIVNNALLSEGSLLLKFDKVAALVHLETYSRVFNSPLFILDKYPSPREPTYFNFMVKDYYASLPYDLKLKLIKCSSLNLSISDESSKLGLALNGSDILHSQPSLLAWYCNVRSSHDPILFNNYSNVRYCYSNNEYVELLRTMHDRAYACVNLGLGDTDIETNLDSLNFKFNLKHPWLLEKHIDLMLSNFNTYNKDMNFFLEEELHYKLKKMGTSFWLRVFNTSILLELDNKLKENLIVLELDQINKPNLYYSNPSNFNDRAFLKKDLKYLPVTFDPAKDIL